MDNLLCANCKIKKPFSLFAKDNSRGRGFRYWCKQCDKEKRQKSLTYLRQKSHIYYLKTREKQLHKRKERDLILKYLCFQAYGGPICACCKEKQRSFLSIDHVNGGGYAHLKEIGGHLYRWLKKNNFPPGFQVLCMNCQFGKQQEGICPHQFSLTNDKKNDIVHA